MKGKQKTLYSQVLNDMGDIKPACPPKLNVKERKVSFLNWKCESCFSSHPTKVNDNDPEIPHSQTADKPVALQGRAIQQSRDAKKTN